MHTTFMGSYASASPSDRFNWMQIRNGLKQSCKVEMHCLDPNKEFSSQKKQFYWKDTADKFLLSWNIGGATGRSRRMI